MRQNLILLAVGLVLCAGLARLTLVSPKEENATPTPIASLTPTRPRGTPSPVPAGVLSIRNVCIGTTRSRVEELHGAGKALESGGVGYGETYSDGLRTHYPLEVTYSGEGNVNSVSGNVLHRGDKDVTITKNEKGETVFEGSVTVKPVTTGFFRV